MENQALKLSLIVPVYNSEKYLGYCLDSILAQSEKDWELILINDGSTDSSGAICDIYSAKDQRIKVVHQINQGVAAARNAGLLLAKGEYVFFIDNDDYLHPKALSLIYHKIAGGADIIINQYIIIGDDDSQALENRFDASLIEGHKSEEVLGYFRRQRLNIMAPWEYVFRRRLATDNRISFRAELGGVDDSVFSPALFCAADSFAVLDSPSYFWRNRGDSQGKRHAAKDYANKLMRALFDLAIIASSQSGEKRRYIYFSFYKNTYALLGIYRHCDHVLQLHIKDWLRQNANAVRLAAFNSGPFHALLFITLGPIAGGALSNRLAEMKGSFLVARHKLKNKLH